MVWSRYETKGRTSSHVLEFELQPKAGCRTPSVSKTSEPWRPSALLGPCLPKGAGGRVPTTIKGRGMGAFPIYQPLNRAAPRAFREVWKDSFSRRSCSGHPGTAGGCPAFIYPPPQNAQATGAKPPRPPPSLNQHLPRHGGAARPPGTSAQRWVLCLGLGLGFWVFFDIGVKTNHPTKPGFVAGSQ